ncbi:MAG: hypothetical protein XD81_0229 [Bacteroidetes bacterium 38_7]|nr:MAG: hypothetical protein XD81_0229 [Bacteroidetes bacterium 38_7]
MAKKTSSTSKAVPKNIPAGTRGEKVGNQVPRMRNPPPPPTKK